jgi:rhomboid protease GluP
VEKRRMCSNCRAFITIDDKVCPYCDFQLGARPIDLRAPDDLVGGLLPSTRFLTTLILIVNSGLYVATMVYSMNSGNSNAFINIDMRTLVEFGAKFGPYLADGQLWRLVTAGFLHGGLMHIAFNSFALLDVGAHVEETYGLSRMTAIYLIATIAGFAVSYWWSPRAVSIGASAGIFGLIGAMLAWGMKERTSHGSSVKSLYSRWLIQGVLISFMPGIDMGAHMGGLAGGFAMGWIAGEPHKSRGADRIWDVAMYVSIIIVLASFAKVLPGLISAATADL